MNESIFSKREGFAPQQNIQADDHFPGWVREAIINEIRDFAQSGASLPGRDRLSLYPLFKPYIWKVLDKKPPGSPMGGPFSYYIPEVLTQCNWYQCYDILEEMSDLIKKSLEEKDLGEFSGKVSDLLAKEGIPWKLEQGKVTRRYHPQIAEQLNRVHILLDDPKLKGPDEQFAKALEHLNKRPNPDKENCIKDAVGALEAVANIIVGAQGKQLNDLLKEEPFKSGIHPTISLAIEKVYAYRGAAPGVGHGQVGPAVVEIQDAIWVLSISAATILYMADKFQ